MLFFSPFERFSHSNDDSASLKAPSILHFALSHYVIGGGFTGLAAALASGFEVLEAESSPGGICCSYYMRPGRRERLAKAPSDSSSFRFEIGGGHWIFGGDPAVLSLVRSLVPMREYKRRASVYVPELKSYVPYPIQNNLRFLGADIAVRALAEMALPTALPRTMQDSLAASFGATLCALFFFPFHELYTCGLYKEIAPQDAYKSPVDFAAAARGAFAETAPAGYNTTFLYPEGGLDALAGAMAARCQVAYGARVIRIDVGARTLHLSDGRRLRFESLISTLPLNRTLEICGLKSKAPADPYTAVLVLNLGGVRGAACPPDHWIYVARSRAGFHRVGIYSNVDESFLPSRGTTDPRLASFYVERAFRGGTQLATPEVDRYAHEVANELREWGYLHELAVIDPTWIEVAYTWSWPGSTWRSEASRLLEEQGIMTVGRYGRWIFQGIADSVRDGLMVGAAARQLC